MAGSCNKIIGEDVQQIHKNIFGNAILKSVSNVGHSMISERPTVVVPIIRDFLNEQNGSVKR